MRSGRAAFAALAAAASALLVLGPGWLQLAPPGDQSLTAPSTLDLPPLFHLDDYQRCLARPAGLYCVGTLELSAGTDPQLMDRLKTLSADQFNFNRTRLHRGLCVSEREPGAGAAAARFARAALAESSRLGLRSRLLGLQYCRTHAQAAAPVAVDGYDQAFLVVAALFVLCNVAGTLYDVYRDQNTKGPESYLQLWSVRSSWRRLTASYPPDTPLGALKPLQGIKVILIVIVIFGHMSFMHHRGYIYNPEFLEVMNHHPLMYVVYNGTSVVQVFVMIASFVFAYNLLLSRDQIQSTVGVYIKCLLHRWARITPVYMFTVSLAATWWRHAGDGPLWPWLAAGESDICRRKFWTQALYVNNLVEPDSRCLIQTWFLAVDMQLYLVAASATVLLLPRPRLALRALSAMLVLSVALNFFLSYYFNIHSILYFINTETLRALGAGQSSFTWMYMSPWSNLSCCVIGLMMAFLTWDLRQRKVRVAEQKWLVTVFRLALPALFVYILAGYWVVRMRHPLLMAVYTAIDRPVFCILCSILCFGLIHGIDEKLWRFLSSDTMQVLGRLTLPMLLVHWFINVAFAATAPQPVHNSYLNLISELTGTVLVTIPLSVLLHLIIELPLLRTLQKLMK